VSAISDTLKRFETTGSVLFSDDFRKNSRDNWTPAMGDWVAEDGMIKQILPSAGRAFLIYDKGNDWSDIEISIDLKSPKKDSNVGIAFRMTNGGKDAYVFRILPTGGVQFAKWINGKFTQIGYWEHPIENETYYNLGVRALGTKFTFYLNGEEIAQAEDDSHSKGTVAFYSYLQESLFDNLKIATAE
jgi:hypothetical protein